MRACPRCSTPTPTRSRTRWYERPFRALTPARSYRCLACGRRYWAYPSAAHANGQRPVERDPAVADRRGQEPGREDAEQVIPTDELELQPAVDDEEPARELTLKDVAELSRAGIGEAVLIELIEMDDIAYPLTPSKLRVPKLKVLKRAGVSDRVLLALLRSGQSADGDRLAAAKRNRRSEDARIVRAGSHAQHEGSRALPAGARNYRPGGHPRHGPPSGSGNTRPPLPVDARNRDDQQRHQHASRAKVLGLIRPEAARLQERA